MTLALIAIAVLLAAILVTLTPPEKRPDVVALLVLGGIILGLVVLHQSGWLDDANEFVYALSVAAVVTVWWFVTGHEPAPETLALVLSVMAWVGPAALVVWVLVGVREYRAGKRVTKNDPKEPRP